MTVNRAYPAGCAAILFGTAIDLEDDDLYVQLVDETYEFDPTDSDLADIPSGQRLGALTPVAGTRTLSGPRLVTDTDVTTVEDVPAGADDVAGVLLVGPGATDANRLLIYVWQIGADRTPIVVVTDDGDVEVEFLDGTILTLGG